MAEFAADARLPIYERAVECGVPEFYDQHGQCWCYLQVLNEVVLMAGWGRDWIRELSSAGVNDV
jgi:hypothetical protein